MQAQIYGDLPERAKLRAKELVNEADIRLTPPPTSCGNLFISAYSNIVISIYDPTLMILDPNGDLLWYYTNFDRKLNFQLQPDGMMTWYEDGGYYVMDSTFQVVDTFKCQNGRRN